MLLAAIAIDILIMHVRNTRKLIFTELYAIVGVVFVLFLK